MIRRFLFLVDSLELGGIQRQLLEVVRALVTRGDVVTLAAMRSENLAMRAAFCGAGSEVLLIGKHSRFDAGALGRLRRLLRREHWSLVQAMSPQMAFWCALLAPLRRPWALVGSVLNTYFFDDRLSLAAERLITNHRLDGVIVNSGRAGVLYRRHVARGLPVAVIRNGVRVTPSTARGVVRSELGVSDVDPVIVTVGRLVPVKGHDVLLDAVAEAHRRGVRPHVVLVGDGPLRMALEQQGRALGLERYVHLVGETVEPERWLAAGDLFVLPSRSEGLPNALLEAMAHGLPCIATRVGGIPEVASHEDCVLLMPAEDSHALAEALVRLCQDTDHARALGERARRVAARRFGMERMIQRTLEFYQQLIARRGCCP
ncbi:MAG: glycosyltransferase family 4 protein [Candidatus Sumerlaeia bacterium]|nr:glycosyltransferase family 4 protein [Candidatus Sumerlaeia bacterium]